MEMPPEGEAAPEPGWVAPGLAEEFPGLGLFTTTLAAGATRSPEPLKERLRELSNRFGGQQAIVLRQRPIPWAYRVFFRHIALDPDETPTPIEQVSLERMRDGRFRSRNRVEDALRIAIVEVGVALQAFDAAKVEGRLGLRLSVEGEEFEGRVTPLAPGTIVLADESRPLGAPVRCRGEKRRAHAQDRAHDPGRDQRQGCARCGARRGLMGRVERHACVDFPSPIRRRVEMPEELLERTGFAEVPEAPADDTSWLPPAPPEGLDTALFEHDERAATHATCAARSRRWRRELGQLFASAFPRTGIDFRVPAPGGGPRMLSVDELERLRDSLASRICEVKTHLGEYSRAEELNRGLIERMTDDPESHKWVRVSNEHIGEPGCRHWHARPRWGVLGMLLGWWRVKVSSGCPLAEAPA